MTRSLQVSKLRRDDASVPARGWRPRSPRQCRDCHTERPDGRQSHVQPTSREDGLTVARFYQSVARLAAAGTVRRSKPGFGPPCRQAQGRRLPEPQHDERTESGFASMISSVTHAAIGSAALTPSSRASGSPAAAREAPNAKRVPPPRRAGSRRPPGARASAGVKPSGRAIAKRNARHQPAACIAEARRANARATGRVRRSERDVAVAEMKNSERMRPRSPLHRVDRRMKGLGRPSRRCRQPAACTGATQAARRIAAAKRTA